LLHHELPITCSIHTVFYIREVNGKGECILKYTALCKFELSATSREEAIAELLGLFPIGERSQNLLAGALDIREKVGATVVHNTIVLPHCRSILVDKLTIAVGRSEAGIGWPENRIHTVILFVSPVRLNAPQDHTRFLSHIAGRIKKFGDRIVAAGNQDELLDLLGFQHEELEIR
jgi:mannitol/fructose-specific phosphotransferase system IIA component (Ntr-type)